jgi:putative addiction module killer protein
LQFETKIFRAADGRAPFRDWLLGLDPFLAEKVVRTVSRMENGNFGDSKPVGGGVWERRIHVGPGLRVYYGRDGQKLVILLAGGSKKRQQADIHLARKLWNEYRPLH